MRKTSRMPPCQLRQPHQAGQAPRHTHNGEARKAGKPVCSPRCLEVKVLRVCRARYKETQSQDELSQSRPPLLPEKTEAEPHEVWGTPTGLEPRSLTCQMVLFPRVLDKSHTPHHPQNTNQTKLFFPPQRHRNSGQILQMVVFFFKSFNN